MKIQEKVHIKVLNYSDVKICVETRTRGYVFEPMRDGIPTFDFMGFEDIEFINSRSSVFRTGALRFEESEEEEIFNALRYPKWKETLLSEKDIDDIIFNPTLKNQERVVNIKEIATLERIRGKLVFYMNEDVDNISTKNADLINNRFKELCANILNSKIVVREIKPEQIYDSELKNMKKQNADLQNQMNVLQEQIAALLQKSEDSEVNSENKADSLGVEGAEGVKPAKRGRPPKADAKIDKE